MIKSSLSHFTFTIIKGILTGFLFFLLLSGSANAAEPKLTADQQARIQAIMKESEAPPPEKLVDAAAKWAELGKSIGIGVVSAARELGVAANEFAQTDVGKVTVAVIVWKFMGQDALDLVDWVIEKVSGALLVFAVTPALLVRARAIGQIYVLTEAPRSILWGLYTYTKISKVDKSRASSLTDSQQALTAAYIIAALIFGIVGLINLF